MDYSFHGKLTWSEGKRGESDKATISALLVGCVDVRDASGDEQRQGIDYVALLSAGAPVFIDTKTRERGASRWWRHGHPELALETWSVKPTASLPNGKIGWTLNQASLTDMVLYTFDPQDSQLCYFVGFQPLRLAFERFKAHWTFQYGKNGQATTQSSDGGRWKSESIFVPASVVLDGIREISRDVTELQEALF